MIQSNIIERIERYCVENDMKESVFGLRSVNDGKLVSRLRDGRTITLGTLDLINAQLQLPPDRSAWEGKTAA